MRAKRLALSPAEQQIASQAIMTPAMELIERYQAQRIAFYLPFNGEISPLPLMENLFALGKQCYLPVLHPFSTGHLLFLAYQGKTKLKTNRFGIQEPPLDVQKICPLTELDLIFVPLVAYDLHGNRLGMGGGFYDRTLAQAPHLVRIGLAHCCQQVTQLPIEPWDIPLDHFITA